MITHQLPLLASIVAVVCLAGWVAFFRQGGSWQRARQVIEEAERDVASWASAQPHELETSGRR